MKRILKITLICFLYANVVLSQQAPQYINYQAVVRNPSSGQTYTQAVNIEFRIYDSLNANAIKFQEQHNAVIPNAFGIVNLKIGKGTLISGSFKNINWSLGKAAFEMDVNGQTIGGRQEFASVPYALNIGGSSIPPGTRNGQTLRWDSTASVSAWKPDFTLNNNGQRIGIGTPAMVANNKLNVQADFNDASAINAFKNNATKWQAAVRGTASGSTSSGSPDTLYPVIGGHFFGLNDLSGDAVGVFAHGHTTNLGKSYGLVGVGTGSNAASAFAIGVYGTVKGNYKFGYSGVFDNGNVIIRDTLQYDMRGGGNNSNGNPGDVLTRITGGKAIWQNPSSLAVGPWVRNTSAAGSVTLANQSDLVMIGSSTGQAKLNVLGALSHTNNVVQVTNTNSTSTNTGIFVENHSGGTAIKAINQNPSAGNAGKFEIILSSNSSDALYASTTGTGAAVHAVSAGTVGALALLLDNGHIKAVGPPTNPVISASLGITPSFVSASANSNDVKGLVSINTSTNSIIPGGYIEVTVQFTKPYSFAPVVVISPMDTNSQLSYAVKPTGSNTSFTVKIWNNTLSSISGVPNLEFSYIVIE